MPLVLSGLKLVKPMDRGSREKCQGRAKFLSSSKSRYYLCYHFCFQFGHSAALFMARVSELHETLP